MLLQHEWSTRWLVWIDAVQPTQCFMWYQFHPSGTFLDDPFETRSQPRQLLIFLSPGDIVSTKSLLFLTCIHSFRHQTCCMDFLSINILEMICPTNFSHPA